MLLQNFTGGLWMQTLLYLSNHSDHSQNNTLEDFYHLPIGADTDINQPKCYGVYGCFPNTYPWTSATRPVSLYPESPSKINPRYPVFKKFSRNVPIFLDLNDPEETRDVGIDPEGTIYFVVHGYIDSGDRPWIEEMVNALLDEDSQGRASVIVVDWGGGSTPPYTQAVANIRLVGAITAHIVHMIYEELKLPNIDQFHMIGHSLGAHLIGYTGFILQRDFGLFLGRITGLDPAEPLFTDTDALVRLDKTDAKYVDVIHTDALAFSSGGLGMVAPIGHVDFYPNGGYNNPGCNGSMSDFIQQEKGSFFWGVQQFFSCNHIRSHQFMTDSIRAKCPTVAISCESYEEFKDGNCFTCNVNNHYCFNFGLKSINGYLHLKGLGALVNNEPLKVYLVNNGKSLHCTTHYKIQIFMSSSEESAMHGGEIGIMSVVVHSFENITGTEDKRHIETETMRFTEEPIYYEPGYKYVSVMSGRNVGIPTYAALSWEYKANPLNPLTWRILSSPRVYVDHIIVETLEHRSKLKLCPIFNYPVISDNSNIFMEEYCHTKS